MTVFDDDREIPDDIVPPYQGDDTNFCILCGNECEDQVCFKCGGDVIGEINKEEE